MSDAEFFRGLLSYNKNSGRLRWKARDEGAYKGQPQQKIAGIIRFNKYSAGKFADTSLAGHGYRAVTIHNTKYKAHRIAWIMEYGSIDGEVIDHLDGDPTNNKIENLRCSTQAENMKNMSFPKHNKSGIVGVRFHKASNKWIASIKHCRKSLHLGIFPDIQDAIAARLAAECELGFSARHGKKVDAGLGKLKEEQ